MRGNTEASGTSCRSWVKSRGAKGNESEQVDLLGMKTTLMSKAAIAAKKAVKGNQKGTTNLPVATRTKAARRKPIILFANQHKEKT